MLANIFVGIISSGSFWVFITCYCYNNSFHFDHLLCVKPSLALPTTQKGESLFYRWNKWESGGCNLAEVEIGFTPRGCTWNHNSGRSFRDTSLTSCPAQDWSWQKSHWFIPKSPVTGPWFCAPLVLMLQHRSPPAIVRTQSAVHLLGTPCNQPLPTAPPWGFWFSRAGLRAWECAFLTSLHRMLILLVRGPHFENDCSRPSFWSGNGRDDSFPQLSPFQD